MIRDTVNAVKQLIIKRGFAYNQVFSRDNKYTHIVLKDLAKFCRACETTYTKDERLHAALEGRREVFLRIQEYLNLTPDEIYELHRAHEMAREDKR